MAAEAELVNVGKLVIDGSDAPLEAPLTLHLTYSLTKPLAGAYWELIYEADMASDKKKSVTLHATEPADLGVGEHQFQHTAPKIETAGIKEKYLLQVGVLKLTLHSANEPNAIEINMITQVVKQGDVLVRSIVNPTE